MAKRITYGYAGPKKMPVGEAHHKAILTDAQVEEIRDLYEAGGNGYRKLAKRFGVSLSCVKHIVQFRRRAATPDGYKTIWVDDQGIRIKRETD